MVHRDALCPAAITGHVSGSHDPVADVEALRRLTHAGHYSGELPAENHSPAVLGAPELSNRRLTGVDRDGADLDQHIAVAEQGLFDLDEFKGEPVERMDRPVPTPPPVSP